MSILIESSLPEAYASYGSGKRHNVGEDSYGRFWFIGIKGTGHTLTIYNSINKFSSFNSQQLGSQAVSGGSSSNCKAEPLYYSLFVDEADFLHVFWKQESSNGSLTAGRLYHLYGKITNSSGNITWYPIREIRNPGSNSASLGDIVCFKAPDQTANVLCCFAFNIVDSGASTTALHFETSKFPTADPGSYTPNVISTIIDTSTSDTGILRPIMTFRQPSSGFNEKTPHATSPHLYIATSNPTIGAFFHIGTYGFASGNVTFSWSSIQMRTRYISSLIGGVTTWHTFIWNGSNPIWVAQGRNASNTFLMFNKMSATSATEVDESTTPSPSTNFYSGGNAWWNTPNNRIYFAGCDDLTNHDVDFGHYDFDTAVWTHNVGEFESTTTDDDPQIAVNPGAQFGYNMLIYVRRNSGSNWQLRAEEDITFNNHTPSTPTGLSCTTPVTDTTPGFSCSVADVDLLEQIKARFTVYQSDMSTVVGTIDSSFRSGSGSVSANYPTPLTPGVYYVGAKAIDDGGASSSETSKVQFQIQGTYSLDADLICDVAAFASIDIDLICDIESSSDLDIDLILDITTSDQLDIDLLIDIDTGWIPQDDTTIDSLWTEVLDAAY